MGNGMGCTSVEQFDESVQMPSLSPQKFSSTPLVPKSYRTPLIKPPPISPIQEEGFIVRRNTDQYSSLWDHSAKVSL
jgi:hypothetical protein